MKEAKFFCEYCDAEVPRNARFCPKCGHFFLSVRCPACGLTGDQDDFNDGCPACGYAFSGNAKSSTTVTEKLPPKAKRSSRKKAARLINRLQDDPVSKKEKRDDPLPLWVYIAVSGALLILLLVLFSRL